jgi:hypothetical protein
MLGVPGERRHPVPLLHPELPQPAAQAVDPIADLGIARARHAVAREGDDLGVAVHAAHPLQHELQRQRMVVLHQPFEHPNPSYCALASIRSPWSFQFWPSNSMICMASIG